MYLTIMVKKKTVKNLLKYDDPPNGNLYFDAITQGFVFFTQNHYKVHVILET